MNLTSRWFSPKIIIKKSRIHGYGVFASKDINKDEIVLISGGVILPKKDLKKYQKENGNLGLQIDDSFYIVPISRSEIKNGGVNHSCNPNIGFYGDVIIKAIKDIKKGEELSIDYCMCYSELEDFKCICDFKKCRKNITADDWKNKTLQKKYKNYFTNYLKSKFKN